MVFFGLHVIATSTDIAHAGWLFKSVSRSCRHSCLFQRSACGGNTGECRLCPNHSPGSLNIWSSLLHRVQDCSVDSCLRDAGRGMKVEAHAFQED